MGNGNRGNPVAERYRKAADIRRHHLVWGGLGWCSAGYRVLGLEGRVWRENWPTLVGFGGREQGEGTLGRTGRVLIRGGDAYACFVPECKGGGIVEVATLGWIRGGTLEFECFASLWRV